MMLNGRPRDNQGPLPSSRKGAAPTPALIRRCGSGSLLVGTRIYGNIDRIFGATARHSRVRLARLALKAAATDDPAAYRAAPADASEFGTDDEPLSWEGEGWQEFGPKG